MKRIALIIFIIAVLVIGLSAQGGAVSKTEKPATQVAVAVDSTPLDLAKATLAAHGGDKLKNIKTLVMKGSLDMNVFNHAGGVFDCDKRREVFLRDK
jgi:Zn-dependent membrane protease YugP